MRANEFVIEQSIDEDRGSGAVRYNTELAMLVAFTGGTSLKNIPKKALANPDKVLAEIKKVLPAYDKAIFSHWLEYAKIHKAKILEHSGSLPKKYDWVAGENAGGVADLVFVGHETSGVSIKDKSGITLANLSPKALGLESPQGVDTFQHYSPSEWVEFKKAVFTLALKEAKASAEPIHPKPSGKERSIAWNPETKLFDIVWDGGVLNSSAKDILAGAEKGNAKWQRVFGDWYQLNFQQHKGLMKKLVIAVSKAFEETIATALEDSDKLKRVLQFEDKPYYYATPKKLYYVPSAADAGDIKLKGIAYGNPDGTSQLFKAKIGHEESGDEGAVLDIYIRFANGLFATNSTARAQSLKDPELISWTLL